MDKVYIDALVQQALGAYRAGGDDGLARWKKGLPAHNLKEFEEQCAKPLQKAIEALQAGWVPQAGAGVEVDQDAAQPTNLRKKHTRDRRRTKPL